MGTAIAVGYAGGLWQDVSPTWLVSRNIGVHGFYLGRPIGITQTREQGPQGRPPPLGERGGPTDRRGRVLLEQARQAHRMIENRQSTGKVVLVP